MGPTSWAYARTRKLPAIIFQHQTHRIENRGVMQTELTTLRVVLFWRMRVHVNYTGWQQQTQIHNVVVRRILNIVCVDILGVSAYT